MHTLEPFYNWRHIYVSEEDQRSPFSGRQYSEFEFSQTVYNYYIHPQWDDFGSRTLYLKVLMADYEERYAIIELIGEWNDAVENDIMELKREVLEKFMYKGINKFILVGRTYSIIIAMAGIITKNSMKNYPMRMAGPSV